MPRDAKRQYTIATAHIHMTKPGLNAEWEHIQVVLSTTFTADKILPAVSRIPSFSALFPRQIPNTRITDRRSNSNLRIAKEITRVQTILQATPTSR
jgi:hypothetical protein